MAELPTGPDLDPALVDLLAERFARMGRAFPASRPVHSRGVLCGATFTPAAGAHRLSRAAHLRGDPVPAVVRFSNGLPGLDGPDTAAQPRGCAVAFLPPGRPRRDLVAVDVPGFFAATPGEFLTFLDALEGPELGDHLARHPLAADYLQRALSVAPPVSWLDVTYHAGHAVVLVDRVGTRRAGRFRLAPAGPERRLGPGGADGRGERYLGEDLDARVGAGEASLRLVVQLAGEGDPTGDIQRLWPEDRRVVELGTLTITAVRDRSPDGGAISFDVAALGEGIEPSDDPLIAARSAVYARSARRRAAAASGPC